MRALGEREAVRYSNGFRTWQLSYADLYARIGAFARYLDASGFHKGDRLLLWAENRPEWLAAFWGAVARGVEVVPVDFRSSFALVSRIQGEVHARLLITGDGVEMEGDLPGASRLTFRDIEALPAAPDFAPTDISPADVVEIVYTSGTTGEPVGIVHRHKNICANLTPIEHEMEKYDRFARPFQPVRILDMLPLSHLFGQSLGIFIPPLLGGAAVFMHDLNPGAILDTIRRERVSVLVAVPRFLKSLQGEIERRFTLSEALPRWHGTLGILERWWRFRQVHRALGFKFWALIVGGAEVPAGIEAFWGRLGFLVVQGYGLTETSPVVALNHPFRAKAGSIGKAIAGQEVRIAADGEILVRGDSVITEYLGPAVAGRMEDGWLHTGDIGEMDAEGRLYYKGRKKEMIVTSEGLNVYPQDVEPVLNRQPGVKESVVIGVRQADEEVVHAVLLLKDAAANPEALVAAANQQLETHQRIRAWSVWPDEDFPRTPSTMKVKRGEVARRVAGGARTTSGGGIEDLLTRVTGRTLAANQDLGISSLERVELLSQIENQYGIELDEDRFAQVSTVGDLKAWLQQADEPRKPESLHPPRWSRAWPVRVARCLALEAAVLPAFRILADLKVEGLENLAGLTGPVLFAANHQSDLDTPAIFAALPRRWRYRAAPAMAQDYFRAWLEPRGVPLGQRLRAMWIYYMACTLFNAYPLPQRMSGVRRALKYTGELIDHGFCPLVYPEGRRTLDGTLQTFQPGIGVMALRLRVPVVPVHLQGMFEIYSVHDEWPRSGPVRVRFGAPVHLEHAPDEEAAARAVEQAVRELEK
jgi:long-chain acyl-CoA synthetase